MIFKNRTEQGLFYELKGNYESKKIIVLPQNIKRPDISIHNPQSIGYKNDLLLDISFVSPLTGLQIGNLTNFSSSQAKKKFRVV